MIAALGVASAYTAEAIGFVVMMVVTTLLPKLPPAPRTPSTRRSSSRSPRA